MNTDIYLAFGSNLGDGVEAIQTAIAFLGERGVEPVALSGLFRSKPKYFSDQPDFINCVGHFKTDIDPRELLAACNEAEKAAGRRRRERYGPRELDVDILLYGEEVISEKSLTIPHPAIAERLFVLTPLAELSCTIVVPGVGVVGELLEEARRILPVQEEVVRLGALLHCGCGVPGIRSDGT